MSSDYQTYCSHILKHLTETNFTGFDPYDGLNTRIRLLHRNQALRLLAVYVNKFSPLNLRTVLKVTPSRQLMTLCTAANAIMLLDDLVDPGQRKALFDEIWQVMVNTSLKDKYGHHCWDAHGFPIQMRGRYTHGDVASVVGNQIFGEFLINYHKMTGDPLAREYALDLRDLFMSRFYCEKEGAAFFRYKSEHPDTHFTLNASTRAARYLMQLSELTGNHDLDNEIRKVIELVVRLQKEDGRWNYTHHFDSGRQKKQVDYHQGFILDDLLLYMETYGRDNGVLQAYEKGLRFYRNKQFLVNGQGRYRYPRTWPANIHNQAQGIVTFANASTLDPAHLDFATVIADWTVRNMYDTENNYFYYLKYPFFKNKIRYARWSDANMLQAMATLVHKPDTN